MSKLIDTLGLKSAKEDLGTAVQLHAPTLKEKDEDTNWGSLILDTINEDWMAQNVYRAVTEDGVVDPDFYITEDHMDQALQDGVFLDNLEYLSDTTSEQDFENVKAKILEEQELDSRIGRAGTGAMLMRLGVNIFDPAGWVAGYGIGHIAKGINLASRMKKIAAMSGVGLAEGAAYEYAVGLDKATWNDDDILVGALAGGMFTGIAGGVMRNRSGLNPAYLQRNKEDIDAEVETLVNRGLSKREAKKIVLGRLENDSWMRESTPVSSTEVQSSYTRITDTENVADVLAASGKHEEAAKMRESLKPKRVDVANAPGYISIMGRKVPVRFDMMWHVLNSKSQVIQDNFSNLAQNVLGDTRGGKVVAMSATEGARVLRQNLGKVFNNINAQRAIFEAGIPKGGDRLSRRSVFAQLIEKAVVREDDYIDNLTYEIQTTNLKGQVVSTKTYKATEKQKKALKHSRDRYREVTDRVRKEAEKWGVKGFSTVDADGNIITEGIAHNKNYVHRRINPKTIKSWRDTLRAAGSSDPDKDLLDIIAEAYKRAIPDDGGARMSDVDARRAARLYMLGIKRASSGFYLPFGQISRANIDELANHIRQSSQDGQLDIDAEEIIKDALSILNKKASKGNATTRRFMIDEAYVHQGNIDGNEFTINIEDLYDRNAYAGLETYIRQMSGRISAAKYMNIRSDDDFNDIIKKAVDEAADTGESITGDLNRVKVMYNHLVGKPTDKQFGGEGTRDSAPHQWMKFSARILQDYNYMRVMNQVGFAQIAEIYNIAALMGWKAMLANMPTLRRMKRDLENGEIMGDDLMRDIESITGIGAEYSRFATVSERFTGTADEVLGDTYTVGQKKMLDLSTKGKRVTSIISGMTPITTATQRLAAKSAVYKMISLTNKRLTEKDYMRFRDLGWDDATTKKIMVQLKKGNPNGKVNRGLDLDNWDDVDLREEFANGLTRWTYRAIQENDIGATGYFMTQTWGKVLSQFRTFMLVSHAKQFLHGAYTTGTRGDIQGAHALLGTSLMGGMAYMLQQYLKNLGTDDDDEFSDMFNADWDDESKYSLKNIATASFQRSSYSSFIPMFTDTALDWGGFEPLFGHGRSTGLGGDILTGSPSFDTYKKAGRLFDETRDAMFRGEEFDPKSLRAIIFSNALGVHNAIEAMAND